MAGSKRTSNVWQFFELLLDDDKRKTQCVICGTRLAYNANTSSMKSHLQSKHALLYSSATGTTIPPVKKAKPNESNEVHEWYPSKQSNSDKLEKIVDGCVTWCVRDLEPFDVVTREGFQEFVKNIDPDFQMPRYDEFLNNLYNTFHDSRVNLAVSLSSQESVCLTTEFWENDIHERFLTITAHYIDNKWNFHHRILDTAQLLEIHSDNVVKELSKIILSAITEFNIQRNATVIVTNKNSDILLASTGLQQSHMCCFADVLQKAIAEGLSERVISDALLSSQKLMCFLHQTEWLHAELVVNPLNVNVHRLVLHSCTSSRWIAVFEMICYLLENRAEVAALTDKYCAMKKFELSDAIWTILDQLHIVLKPLKLTVDQLKQEDFPLVSSVYPFIHCLVTKHLVSKEMDSTEIASLKTVVCSGLQEHFSFERSKIFQAAALFHPRYKSLKFLNEAEKQQTLKLFRDELTQLENQSSASTSSNTIAASKASSSATDTDETGVKFLLGDAYEDLLETSNFSDDELDYYLSVPSSKQDPLVWWKLNFHKFPKLSRHAKSALCIQAMSVSHGRLFGEGCSYLQRKRHRLDSEIVNQILFLYSELHDGKQVELPINGEAETSISPVSLKTEPEESSNQVLYDMFVCPQIE